MRDIALSLLSKPHRYIHDGDWARVYDGNTGRYLGKSKDDAFFPQRNPRRYRVSWPVQQWQRA